MVASVGNRPTSNRRRISCKTSASPSPASRTTPSTTTSDSTASRSSWRQTTSTIVAPTTWSPLRPSTPLDRSWHYRRSARSSSWHRAASWCTLFLASTPKPTVRSSRSSTRSAHLTTPPPGLRLLELPGTSCGYAPSLREWRGFHFISGILPKFIV